MLGFWSSSVLLLCCHLRHLHILHSRYPSFSSSVFLLWLGDLTIFKDPLHRFSLWKMSSMCLLCLEVCVSWIALSKSTSLKKQALNLINLEPELAVHTFDNSQIAVGLSSGFHHHHPLQYIARNNTCPPVTYFSIQHSSIMMNDRTSEMPASSESVLRKYSPHCESTGPTVPEGFVAARVRALQGLNQAQIATRSHLP